MSETEADIPNQAEPERPPPEPVRWAITPGPEGGYSWHSVSATSPVASDELARVDTQPQQGQRWDAPTGAMREPTAQETTEEARARKRTELKQQRYRNEYGTFEHGGVAFQCDLSSATKISTALSNASDGLAVLPLQWIAADNSVVGFTALAELVAWNQSLSDHVQGTYQTYGQHLVALSQSSNPASYDATTGWS